MGGGSSPQPTTTETSPWGPQQPVLKSIYGKVQKGVEALPGAEELYKGPLQVEQRPEQKQALESVIAEAPRQQELAEAARAQILGTVGGEYLGANPYLQQAIQGAIAPAQEKLLEQVLPTISGAAKTAGAFGGSRQGIVERGALRDFDRMALETAGRMQAGAYERERAMQQQAIPLTAQVMQQQLAPYQNVLSAAAQLRGLDQEAINEIIAQEQRRQTAPFGGLATASNIITGGGFGTQTTSGGPGRQSGGAQGALMGGIGGAGAASALGMTGPAGWAMLGGGALLGML